MDIEPGPSTSGVVSSVEDGIVNDKRRNPSIQSNSSDDDAYVRSINTRKRGSRKSSDEKVCPLCSVTIRSGQFEAHWLMEIEKLQTSSSNHSRKRRRKQSRPKDRVFQDIQMRRVFRSEASKLKSGVSEDVVCPLCHQDQILTTYEKFQEHFNECLRGDSDLEDVTGDEYEWCGIRKVRMTSLMKSAGNLESLGTIVKKSDELEDVDICDIPEETTSTIQYTDEDIAPTILEASEPKDLEESTLPDERVLVEALKSEIKDMQKLNNGYSCKICHGPYDVPVVSISCWHVHCEKCWLQSLGSSMTCPNCKAICQPKMLRKIFL